MEYKHEEIKAGLMVVLSIVILATIIVLISGLDLLKSTKLYTVRFRNSNGIVIGSIVRYAGMQAGKVTDVKLPEDDNTIIEFILMVDEKTPIKIDSEAFISSIGILGDYYVEITTGSLDKPLLPAGRQIESRETIQIMQLTEPIEDISLKLQDLIDRMNMLVNEQSQYHIASIISQLDTMLIHNRENISLTIESLKCTSENFEKISYRLDSVLNSDEIDIKKTAQKIDQTIEKMQTLISTTNESVSHLSHSVTARENQLGAIIENMELITNNLEKFSQSIKERPWNLVRINAPKERKIQR